MSDDVLVLWDIDDTLLNSGGAGRDLYDAVFSQLFGQPLKAHAPMDGRTDRAFILETLELAGIDEPRRYVDPFMAGLATHAQTVHSAVAARGQALPGAATVLAALAAARSVGSFAAFGTEFPGLIDWGTGALAPAVQAAAVHAGAVHAGTVQAGAVHAGTVRVAPAAARAMQTVPLPGGSVPLPGGSLPMPGGSVPPGVGAAAAGAAQAAVPAPYGVQTVLGPAAFAQLIPAQAAAVQPVVSTRTAAHPAAAQPPEWHPVTPRRPVRRIYQSVLTGNIRAVAETKLAALGLRDGLDLCIGAYGEDHEDRIELVHVARRRAAGVHGRSATAFAGTATVVIGNTPLDVSVALSAAARAVGVATGSYTAADLRAAGAHAVLDDLTDTRAVLRALLA